MNALVDAVAIFIWLVVK